MSQHFCSNSGVKGSGAPLFASLSFIFFCVMGGPPPPRLPLLTALVFPPLITPSTPYSDSPHCPMRRRNTAALPSCLALHSSSFTHLTALVILLLITLSRPFPDPLPTGKENTAAPLPSSLALHSSSFPYLLTALIFHPLTTLGHHYP